MDNEKTDGKKREEWPRWWLRGHVRRLVYRPAELHSIRLLRTLAPEDAWHKEGGA